MSKNPDLTMAEIAYQAARKAKAAGEPEEVVQGLLRRAGLMLRLAKEQGEEKPPESS